MWYRGCVGTGFCGWAVSKQPKRLILTNPFQILFMIIIGGLGSMLGSFIGAAFIVLMPIVLTNVMVYGLVSRP